MDEDMAKRERKEWESAGRFARALYERRGVASRTVPVTMGPYAMGVPVTWEQYRESQETQENVGNPAENA